MIDALRAIPGAEPCFFKKGEILIAEGDYIDYVYFLRKGVVYREIITDKGMESVLSFKESGGLTDSIIGVLLLYSPEDERISTNNFIAGSDCSCIRIPADGMRKFFSTRPEQLECIIGTALRECNYLMNLYLGKAALPAPAVLARWVLERTQKDGNGEYLANYNNNDIAKILSIHKVTVSRIFGALRDEGIIKKIGRTYRVLDHERLQAIADNEVQIKYS